MHQSWVKGHKWHIDYAHAHLYPPAIAVRDIVIAVVCLSVRPSVTLSCLRDNLSKHGWILIIFCLWLATMSLLRTKGDILF